MFSSRLSNYIALLRVYYELAMHSLTYSIFNFSNFLMRCRLLTTCSIIVFLQLVDICRYSWTCWCIRCKRLEARQRSILVPVRNSCTHCLQWTDLLLCGSTSNKFKTTQKHANGKSEEIRLTGRGPACWAHLGRSRSNRCRKRRLQTSTHLEGIKKFISNVVIKQNYFQ